MHLRASGQTPSVTRPLRFELEGSGLRVWIYGIVSSDSFAPATEDDTTIFLNKTNQEHMCEYKVLSCNITWLQSPCHMMFQGSAV